MDDRKPRARDRVDVVGSREGGRTVSYRGTVRKVLPSGTLIVDDETARDGAGTPRMHYCSGGTVTVLPAIAGEEATV